jgi:hypothetical protein
MHKHHHRQSKSALSDSNETTNTAQVAVVSGEANRHAESVSAEEIRVCAYRKWESAGKPAGDGLQFWLAAEQELRKTGRR